MLVVVNDAVVVAVFVRSVVMPVLVVAVVVVCVCCGCPRCLGIIGPVARMFCAVVDSLMILVVLVLWVACVEVYGGGAMR